MDTIAYIEGADPRVNDGLNFFGVLSSDFTQIAKSYLGDKQPPANLFFYESVAKLIIRTRWNAKYNNTSKISCAEYADIFGLNLPKIEVLEDEIKKEVEKL